VGLEEVKEFKHDDVLAIRFEGKDIWQANFEQPGIDLSGVIELASPDIFVLKGEAGQVGMVKFYLEKDKGVLLLTAAGLLDYQSAERLHLDNGELGLRVEVRLGKPGDVQTRLREGLAYPAAIYIASVNFERLPPGSSRQLVATPMRWTF
jgi:hypothetical protein